jgi:hypothetical protein
MNARGFKQVEGQHYNVDNQLTSHKLSNYLNCADAHDYD